ncbi:hypothetical protein K456DRAFT_1077921 [Colletotrichum gloeosporioides 23]|nr:hypothetical protein K456DRAFT_1077921 [Colletotrichum gloeosporioides 23]
MGLQFDLHGATDSMTDGADRERQQDGATEYVKDKCFFVLSDECSAQEAEDHSNRENFILESIFMIEMIHRGHAGSKSQHGQRRDAGGRFPENVADLPNSIIRSMFPASVTFTHLLYEVPLQPFFRSRLSFEPYTFDVACVKPFGGRTAGNGDSACWDFKTSNEITLRSAHSPGLLHCTALLQLCLFGVLVDGDYSSRWFPVRLG